MRFRARRKVAFAAACALVGLCPQGGRAAEEPRPVLNWYGQSGLLDMPSARMLPDGELAVTIASLGSLSERYNLTFQALPWLEASFRYARIDKLAGNGDLFDRSLSFKARLVQENGWIPNIALGFQDILGTGVFGAEYFVATKSFGNVDATLGLGWGRFSTIGTFKNPFLIFGSAWGVRPPVGFNGTGQVRFNQFFHGPDTAPFGGLVWHTGIEGLSGVIEVSSDRYLQEQQAGAIAWRNPLNIGVSYSPWQNVEIGAGYFYGTLFGIRVSLSGNPSVDAFPRRLGAPAPGAALRTADDRRRAVSEAGNKAAAPLANEAQIRGRILELADQQRVQIESLSLSAHEAAIVVNNTRYRRETDAIGRLTRILMAATPPEVERFRFVSLENGLPTREIVLERSAIERTIMARGDAREILPASDIRPASPQEPLLREPAIVAYPRFGWALTPQLRESLFDPSQPFRYQIFAAASGNVELTRGLNLDATFEVNLFDNFHNLRPSNSELPHVRSDANLYYTEGKNGIDHLRLTYVRTLAPDVYGLIRGGYLESMFAGFGGEVLWRPERERWALGFAAYQVWQRDFDRLFGLMSYNVLVAHASLYYASPFYGLNFNLHAGRYLAGDYGATLEMTRRFETGVEIGAFFTFTNVPFSKFGEGSFDKGIIIRIPLESVLPIHSQSEARLDFTSLTRDGGQRLGDEQSLYSMTRRTSYGEVLEGWHAITAP
jgi:hypothetical protein